MEIQPAICTTLGCVFEALVKSAKKALKTILGDADINDEELHTAICRAEEMLNSRPITYVSSDPNDLTPLTPNHFLVRQLGGRFAPEALPEEVYRSTKRWHRLQQLLKLFWQRWQKEFLPSLNIRSKWFHPKHNFETRRSGVHRRAKGQPRRVAAWSNSRGPSRQRWTGKSGKSKIDRKRVSTSDSQTVSFGVYRRGRTGRLTNNI